MDGYVNVNFLWGGEIIKQDNDVLYSLDPKEMKYVKLGTSFEELRDMVFGLMHISRHHWDVKLSVKYLRIGVGNLVSGFFVKSIKSDDDVSRMLSIPVRFHLGGDVSLFIEAESIAQPSQHYVGVLEVIMGGTMDKASSRACQGGLAASLRAATTTGRLGSLVEARVIRVVLLLKRLERRTILVEDSHHRLVKRRKEAMTIYEPRASWFGSQDYELVIVSNADALMSLGFDPTTDELTEGALFASKEVLTSVVK
ncbi:hypothetical protein ACET3Z_013616 [Daucus carota]